MESACHATSHADPALEMQEHAHLVHQESFCITVPATIIVPDSIQMESVYLCALPDFTNFLSLLVLHVLKIA